MSTQKQKQTFVLSEILQDGSSNITATGNWKDCMQSFSSEKNKTKITTTNKQSTSSFQNNPKTNNSNQQNTEKNNQQSQNDSEEQKTLSALDRFFEHFDFDNISKLTQPELEDLNHNLKNIATAQNISSQSSPQNRQFDLPTKHTDENITQDTHDISTFPIDSNETLENKYPVLDTTLETFPMLSEHISSTTIPHTTQNETDIIDKEHAPPNPTQKDWNKPNNQQHHHANKLESFSSKPTESHNQTTLNPNEKSKSTETVNSNPDTFTKVKATLKVTPACIVLKQYKHELEQRFQALMKEYIPPNADICLFNIQEIRIPPTQRLLLELYHQKLLLLLDENEECNIKTLLSIAIFYFVQSRPYEGLKWIFNQNLEKYSEYKNYKNIFENIIGNLYYALEIYQEAQHHFIFAISSKSSLLISPKFMLGNVYLQQKDYQLSLSNLLASKNMFQHNPYWAHAMGKCYFNLQKFTPAWEYYRMAYDQLSWEPRIKSIFLNLTYQLGKYSDFLELTNNPVIRSEKMQDVVIPYRRAICLFFLEHRNECASLLQNIMENFSSKLTKISPSSSMETNDIHEPNATILSMFLTLHNNNIYEQNTFLVFDKIFESQPSIIYAQWIQKNISPQSISNPDILMHYGKFLKEAHEWELAHDFAKEALRLNPKNKSIILLFAKLRIKKHPDSPESIKLLLELENKNIADAEALMCSGEWFFDQKQWQKAMTFLEKAKNLGLETRQLWRLLGLCHSKLNQFQEAKKYLNLALPLFQETEQQLPIGVELGKAEFESGELDNARVRLESILKIKPNLPEPHFYLSKIYQKLSSS